MIGKWNIDNMDLDINVDVNMWDKIDIEWVKQYILIVSIKFTSHQNKFIIKIKPNANGYVRAW